jgi:hypothetical protein
MFETSYLLGSRIITQLNPVHETSAFGCAIKLHIPNLSFGSLHNCYIFLFTISILGKSTDLKPVSQIHRFHLRLGYDVFTACFLVISVGGRAVSLLPQYCSSIFHAAGAPSRHRQVLTFH